MRAGLEEPEGLVAGQAKTRYRGRGRLGGRSPILRMSLRKIVQTILSVNKSFPHSYPLLCNCCG